MRRQPMLLSTLAVVVLLAGGARQLFAQQAPPYGVEEYNAYVATARAQNPGEQLQAIDSFLLRYPQSVLRAFVYPTQAQAAFGLKNYKKAMEAVDAFWGLDRAQVTETYKQSKYNDSQIENSYFSTLILFTYSFLQTVSNGTAPPDALMTRAAERAGEGLRLHARLYGPAQPPADAAARQQFEQQKQQQEAAFHSVLSFVAWRSKDYTQAAREYTYLVEKNPNEAVPNYRLGLSLLQKNSPDYLHGFWHVARAIAFNVGRKDDVKEFLANRVAAYQQAVPSCIESDVADIIAQSTQSVHPPAGWSLVSADQVNAVRQDMSVRRIFDDLQAGGEAGRLMWLASCGTEIGADENAQPQMAVLLVEIAQSEENQVTLRVAAGQEAADSKTPNMEVVLDDPAAADGLKAQDVVRIAGQLDSYQSGPPFVLHLSKGKVTKADDMVEEVVVEE